MSEKENSGCCEKFKTSIGGQALIEGIMMRGPEKDAIVIRTPEGLQLDVKTRRIRPKGSVATWPFIRGCVNFFDSQVQGVKALMHSADLSPEMEEETPSKLDQWLERKLGNERFQKFVIGTAVFMGLGLSIFLFFLLPMVIGGLFDRWLSSNVAVNLVEGLIPAPLFPDAVVNEAFCTLRSGGTLYTLGTKMQARLVEADPGSGRITFAPVEEK